MQQIGVYQIQNITDGKRYVGSTTKGFKTRWQVHLAHLRSGIHANKHLQGAFVKYGEDAFRFSILAVVDVAEDCIPAEQRFINELQPEYNIRLVAENNLGLKHSEEARIKMHNAQLGNKKGLGKKLSEETKAKIQDSRKWYRPSEETKAKISKALKGNPGPNKGIPRTEEVKAKISAANKGKSAPNKNKPMSVEQKASLSTVQIARTNKIITIMGTHKDTGEVVYFTSAKAAERAGYGCHSTISKCCNGNRKTCHRYIWEYI